jgi:outer membrane protein TolC
MNKLCRALPWILLFVMCTSGLASAQTSTQPIPPSASARGIYKSYLLAKANEPAFQTARAELEVGQVGVSVARAAYYPQLQYSRVKENTETGQRSTLQLQQPLIALDRWATFREAPHREALATLTYDQREQELAARIVKIVSDMVRYSENMRSNKSRVEALTLQYKAAQRMYQLGEGTVTDVADTRVRLGQAKADGLNLEAKLEEARRLYAYTCGEAPQLAEFQMLRRARKVADLESLPDVKEANAQVGIAKQNHEIADLGILKAKSAITPTVTANASKTEANNTSNTYVGVSLTMPLQAQGYYGIASARANETKAREQLRETEQKLQLDLERLKTLIKSGNNEIDVRLETIEAAEINVSANEKSFKGGVRSKTDVLNAIQQLYQSNDDYVTATLTLADNYLNYLLAASVRTDTALQLVNGFLFQ